MNVGSLISHLEQMRLRSEVPLAQRLETVIEVVCDINHHRGAEAQGASSYISTEYVRACCLVFCQSVNKSDTYFSLLPPSVTKPLAMTMQLSRILCLSLDICPVCIMKYPSRVPVMHNDTHLTASSESQLQVSTSTYPWDNTCLLASKQRSRHLSVYSR